MSGTKAGGIKARESVYRSHGKDFYKIIGAKGGRNGHTGGFASNPELARRAGQIGGLVSRRTGVKNGEGKTPKKRKVSKKIEEEFIYFGEPKTKRRGLLSRLFGDK